jgi:Asp23 family, cell envelope-related function
MSRVLVSDDGGSVRVSEAALVKLVDGAVAAVDGARLRKRRRLSLDLADGRARAELEISLPYGVVMPEAARVVQENVARVLTEICGAEVDAVDIAVVELTR